MDFDPKVAEAVRTLQRMHGPVGANRFWRLFCEHHAQASDPRKHTGMQQQLFLQLWHRIFPKLSKAIYTDGLTEDMTRAIEQVHWDKVKRGLPIIGLESYECAKRAERDTGKHTRDKGGALRERDNVIGSEAGRPKRRARSPTISSSSPRPRKSGKSKKDLGKKRSNSPSVGSRTSSQARRARSKSRKRERKSPSPPRKVRLASASLTSSSAPRPPPRQVTPGDAAGGEKRATYKGRSGSPEARGGKEGQKQKNSSEDKGPLLSAVNDIGRDAVVTLRSRPWLLKAGAIADENGTEVTGWFKCSEVVLALTKMGLHTSKDDLVQVAYDWPSHDPGGVLEIRKIKGVVAIRAKFGHTWPGVLVDGVPAASESIPVTVFVGVAALRLEGGIFDEIRKRGVWLEDQVGDTLDSLNMLQLHLNPRSIVKVGGPLLTGVVRLQTDKMREEGYCFYKTPGGILFSDGKHGRVSPACVEEVFQKV